MQDASIVKLAIQFPGTELATWFAAGSLKRISGASETSGRAYSSVGLERTPDKREVGGSNPPRPTTFRHSGLDGAVAQLVERQLCKLDVVGSTPISSTSSFSGTSRPGAPRSPRLREATSSLTIEYEG
jgi:hypothetical protein